MGVPLLRRRVATWLVAASLAAGVPYSLAADVPSPYVAGCDTRVIVSFTDETLSPDERMLADLGQTTGVRLSLVRLVAPNQFLFWATGSPHDPGCKPMVERLRRDPRIRSVDIDARRAKH